MADSDVTDDLEPELIHTRSQTIDSVIELAAGNLGALASVCLEQPFDTVKTKMQTFPSMYSNSYQCFRTALRTDGLMRGLYPGTLASIAGGFCENAVMLLCYDVCHKVIESVSDRSPWALTPLDNAMTGSSAALFSSLVVCPESLVRSRLQAAREMASTGHAGALNRGSITLTRDIIAKEGVKGLYRGLSATLLREMTGYFFFFGAYDLCRQAFAPEGKHEISSMQTILCGGVGGVVCWSATFPIDVVKTRIQVFSAVGTTPSISDVFLDIIRTEGFRRLYAGLGPTLIRIFPSSGCFLLVYEQSKAMLIGLHETVYPEEI